MAKPIKVQKMSRGESELLCLYFSQNPSVKRFKKNATHTVTIESQKYNFKYNFKLSHDVIRYKDNQFQIITDTELGRGAYATVYKGGGKLIPQKGNFFVFKNEKERAIKINTKYSEQENIKNEARLTKQSGLPTKLPIFIDEILVKDTSYIIMNKVSGCALAKILQDDKNNNKKLSIDDRIILSKNLLEALVKLHEKCILHVDIHANNIMVNTETWEVTIIDYGQSRKLCPQNKDTGKDDLFAKDVLNEIWKDLILAKVENFSRISCLDENEKTKIKTILKHREAIVERTSSEDAWNKFCEIDIERKAKNEVEKKMLIVARENALSCQSECDKIFNSENLDIANIKKIVNSALNEIYCNKEAIKQFVESFGVKMFKDFEKKEDILDKIDEIINNETYQKTPEELADIFCEARVQHILKKRKAIKNLDDLNAFNLKYSDVETVMKNKNLEPLSEEEKNKNLAIAAIVLVKTNNIIQMLDDENPNPVALSKAIQDYQDFGIEIGKHSVPLKRLGVAMIVFGVLALVVGGCMLGGFGIVAAIAILAFLAKAGITASVATTVVGAAGVAGGAGFFKKGRSQAALSNSIKSAADDFKNNPQKH